MAKQYHRLTYILLIHLFVVYHTTQVFAQNPLDTIYIKNYDNADYQAANLNYTGLKGADGYYYFANENGVLKYDGSKWQLISIKNFAATFALAQGNEQRIYVGSMNEFGYLEKQGSQYVYQSLSDGVNKSTQEIWQIVVVSDDVYFSSYEGIFRYDGKDVHFIDLYDAHIFKIGNKVIASVFNGGIYELKNDKPMLRNSDLKLLDDAIYAILPAFYSSHYLILTSENGIWELDTTNYELTKLNLDSDNLLKSKGIYDAVPIMNNMYAIATWFGGVFIISSDGEVILNVDKSYGLASSETREIFTDQRGHLWVSTTSGISHLYWNRQLFDEGYEPTTVITDQVISYAADSSMVGVTFHFATPGFEKSELEYRYFLEGFEDDYSDWTKEIKKEYTNLNGGKYTFYVQAKLPTGEITTETQSTIEVPTPWYLNKWFIAAIIAGIAIIVYSVYKIRTKNLKQLNSRLAKIIDNRTKELIEQREQLKVTNKELKITNSELDNFVYRSSHDLVAPQLIASWKI